MEDNQDNFSSENESDSTEKIIPSLDEAIIEKAEEAINTASPAEETSEGNNNDVDFTNHQIDSNSLPKIEEIVYENVQKVALHVDLLVTGIICLFMLIGFIFALIFSDFIRSYYLIFTTIFLLIVGFLFLMVVKGFKNIGYALREHDVSYKSGWLWRSNIVIPYNRIQHLEVHQGPFDRLFDIASLTIYTAGGSETEIEGLLPDQANSMKAFIMDKNKDLKVIAEENESTESI